MVQAANNSGTRRQILRAALKHFANAGYAATSVQQIVGDAKVSKPALYYHFRDKAALFEALVNEAHDGSRRPRERFSRAVAGSAHGVVRLLSQEPRADVHRVFDGLRRAGRIAARIESS
jgi:AcrR family transcriptional regulator